MLRIFENMNETGECALCSTKEPGSIALIPLDGTRDGNIEQAVQVHIKCLNLRMSEKKEFLYQMTI